MFPKSFWPSSFFPRAFWPKSDTTAVTSTTLPRVLMRANVQSVEVDDTVVSLSAVDQLSSEDGPLGRSKRYPPLIPAPMFLGAPSDSVNRAFPFWIGEKSDEGATDPATGTARSKGVVPLLYIGRQSITAIGAVSSPLPPALVVDESIPAPTIKSVTRAAFNIPAGWPTSTISYASAVVDDGSGGEKYGTISSGSFVGPHQINSVTVDSGCGIHIDRVTSVDVKYYVVWTSDDLHYHPLTNPNAGRIGIATHVGVGPKDYWYADQVASGASPDAYYSILTTPNVAALDLWDAYLVCLGPIFRIYSLYGSDLGKGVPENTPDRMKLVLSEHSGSDLLIAWDTDGNLDPHWDATFGTNTFVTYTNPEDGKDYDCTVVFMRGPISEDHKSGKVTLAVNGWGRESQGDGRGLPYVDAHDIQQHIYENCFIGGKTSGRWFTAINAPKFRNGVPKVRSSSFRARQDFTATALGGRGLRWSLYTDKDKTIDEWERMMMASSVTRRGTNSQGQVIIYGFDASVDTSSWLRLRHDEHFIGALKRVRGEEKETSTLGQGDWDADAEKFRLKSGPWTDTDAILKNKGKPRPGKSIDSLFLDRQADLDWVLQQRLVQLAYGGWYVEGLAKVHLMRRGADVGDGVLLTSAEGTGSGGYVNRPFVIIRRKYSVANNTLKMTLWDVNDLLP